MITPLPKDTRPTLGSQHYVFVGAMLLVCLLIELSSRLLWDQNIIAPIMAEALGLFTYLPLALAMLVLHRYIRYASNSRLLFTTAVLILFVSQLADFMGMLTQPAWLLEWKGVLSVVEGALFSLGSIALLAASYTALIEAETGHEMLQRKRELLESEVEEREMAEEGSRRARAELTLRVRERTAELAERNEQLAEQLGEGERIRAELEHSYKLLSEMEQITRCGGWEIDTTTETITGTDECYRIFEMERGKSYKSTDLIRCFSPDTLKRVVRLRRKVEEEGTPWDLEIPIVAMKGTHRWVRTLGQPTRALSGKGWRISGTIQDITERKSAELALRESENLLHAVITTAPIFLWALDTTGRITLNTGMGLTRLGFSAGRNVGNSVFDLYTDHPQIPRMVRGALAGDICTEVVEFNSMYFHTTYSPMFDVDGTVKGAIGVAIDVTKEHTFDARMRQRQKMEAIGALAGGVAHDFNNLLYAMDGFAALAAKEAAALPTAVTCLTELRTTVARATELVDRILAFSRQDAPRRVAVNLLSEVDNAAALIRTTFPDGITLQLDLHPDVPSVEGDPAQVQQVLMNLCANARYAMRDTGGELVIAARPRMVGAEEAVALGGIEPGNYAELSVSDSGSGMDTNIAGRIFEPFFTTKPVGEGTGLGLAIVHSIVEAHGGAVSILSAPGQGTRVQLLLHAAGSEMLPEGTPPQPVQVEEHAWPSRRVAVIDDESQIRLFLRIMLEDAGHTPLCYRSGEEALAAITAMASPPDVAVVDLVMPGMGGIALSQSLKQAYPDMPIIMCTGYVEAERSPEVQALGLVAFVKKPVPPGLLLQVISDATAQAPEVVAT